MNIDENYNELMDKYKEMSTLGSIRSVLNYDIETKIMSPAGLEHRGNQFSLLASLIHRMQNEPEYIKLITSLHDSDNLDEVQKRNVELLYRRYISASVIPENLIKQVNIQANLTNKAWKNAKNQNNWNVVKNEVTKLFELTKQRGDILNDKISMGSAQSALLNERDPGFTTNVLDTIFNETRQFLIPLISKIVSSQEDMDLGFLKHDYPFQVKRRMTETIADLYQFDYASKTATGRIGDVEHPLTITCGPKDVRVTVNYSKNYIQIMSSMQHELGHGLHALHRPAAYMPISHLTPPSINEMTSRYTENKIGKTQAFFDAYFPTFQKVTSSNVLKYDLYKGFTWVKPGAIRTEADEVTYGLHIIIRYEIEKMLFSEQLEFDEVPEVWNEKYEKYLGVEIEDMSNGPLQDLHWYSYYWTYFQGYALGDLLGSQVHHHMMKQVPSWEEDLRGGDMSTINMYLNENIYALGAKYDPLDMIQHVTGEKLNSKYLRMYLESKYLD